MSQKNKQIIEELFLAGKKNCDIIFIWQLEKSLDVYIRDLWSYTLEIKKVRVAYSKPEFLITTKRAGRVVRVSRYKALEDMLAREITYYSTERSEVSERVKKNTPKKKKNENSVQELQK